MNYATVTDIIRLKRTLSLDEQSRAAALIPEVCDAIRYEAQKVGKNFDEMVFVSELGTQFDALTGDGDTTEFTLSDTPVGNITVRRPERRINSASRRSIPPASPNGRSRRSTFRLRPRAPRFSKRRSKTTISSTV
ncbi:MAG: hypothetical protein IIW01_04340 [Thermoguttaceae bacterium]|nr:hypothetical protein [Thermoguttaceae bacterium]